MSTVTKRFDRGLSNAVLVALVVWPLIALVAVLVWDLSGSNARETCELRYSADTCQTLLK